MARHTLFKFVCTSKCLGIDRDFPMKLVLKAKHKGVVLGRCEKFVKYVPLPCLVALSPLLCIVFAVSLLARAIMGDGPSESTLDVFASGTSMRDFSNLACLSHAHTSTE